MPKKFKGVQLSWLERTPDKGEVLGSTPSMPTIFPILTFQLRSNISDILPPLEMPNLKKWTLTIIDKEIIRCIHFFTQFFQFFANGTNREIIEEIDKEIIRCIHFVLVSALYSPFRRVLKCRQLKNVPSLTGLTIRFLTSQMEQTGK